jgi:hypothetical protein
MPDTESALGVVVSWDWLRKVLQLTKKEDLQDLHCGLSLSRTGAMDLGPPAGTPHRWILDQEWPY